MAMTFKFSAYAPIAWPPACVVCGNPHPRTDKAHGGTVSGLSWWGLGLSVKYRTVALEFPICKRHYMHFRIARFFYFFSFLIFLFSSTQILLWQELDVGRKALVVSIMSIALVVFLASVFASPVRIRTDVGSAVRVKISNEIYAKKFYDLNRGFVDLS